MEVILLEKIINLGDVGDKVVVKSGYGRNYLIPQGKVVVATAEKIEEFEQKRVELLRKETERLEAAQARAEAIGKLEIIIKQKAGNEGKLFGSIGIADIAKAVTATGVIEVQKHEINMPDGVIRSVGDYAIAISLHSNITVTLSIKVVAES